MRLRAFGRRFQLYRHPEADAGCGRKSFRKLTVKAASAFAAWYAARSRKLIGSSVMTVGERIVYRAAGF
jgi:hypothetical protein